MNKILKYLQSPYPAFYQRWKVALASSVIVFLILFFLQPFGIANIGHNKLWVLLGYMVVTGVFLCIPLYLLPWLFPKIYQEERWTMGKQIINDLLIFFFISSGNWLYSGLIFESGLRWSFFLSFLLATMIVGLFPVVFFMLLNRNQQLAFHLREAMDMNQHLQKENIADADGVEAGKAERRILFRGGSKELLEIDVCELCYVEADGNYVKITYWKEGRTVQQLLRATMKQVEAVTADCPFVVKCHRAFLVNVRTVVNVSGNSQGYRLSLQGCDEEVPVSRVYSKEIKTLIKSREDTCSLVSNA